MVALVQVKPGDKLKRAMHKIDDRTYDLAFAVLQDDQPVAFLGFELKPHRLWPTTHWQTVLLWTLWDSTLEVSVIYDSDPIEADLFFILGALSLHPDIGAAFKAKYKRCLLAVMTAENSIAHPFRIEGVKLSHYVNNRRLLYSPYPGIVSMLNHQRPFSRRYDLTIRQILSYAQAK